MTGTIRRHEHAAAMRDTLQEHTHALRDVDYQLLKALEWLRTPHDLASVNAALRQARRTLLAHLDETDAAAWDASVRAAFRDDIPALFPAGTHSEQNARTGGPPPEEAHPRD